MLEDERKKITDELQDTLWHARLLCDKEIVKMMKFFNQQTTIEYGIEKVEIPYLQLLIDLRNALRPYHEKNT